MVLRPGDGPKEQRLDHEMYGVRTYATLWHFPRTIEIESFSCWWTANRQRSTVFHSSTWHWGRSRVPLDFSFLPISKNFAFSESRISENCPWHFGKQRPTWRDDVQQDKAVNWGLETSLPGGITCYTCTSLEMVRLQARRMLKNFEEFRVPNRFKNRLK